MSMLDISAAERRIAERMDAGVTQGLAVSDTGSGVAFSNVGEMMEFAKMMAVANSGVRKHLRGNAGACLAILTQSLEWGMSPFAVANKSYFVNDQIAFESQLVQAVILRRAPIRGRIKFEYEGDGQNRRCRAWARLREDDEVVDYLSPTIKDIKVKNSPLWVGDPDQQLAYFSGRSLCRRHFPDVLLGIYAEDEIEREPPAIGPDRARDVSPPRSLSGKLDALANMADPAQDAPALSKPNTEAAAEGGGREAAALSSQGADAAQVAEQSEGDDVSTESPREVLLAEVRSQIMEGEKVTKILNGLGDRRELLTDDDVKGLRMAEKALADRGAGAT